MAETFEDIMEDYIVPAMPYEIKSWTTDDLVKIIQLADAELQRRAAEGEV